MNVQQRLDLMARLGEYILKDDDNWQSVKEKAGHQNKWFTPGFTSLATRHIGHSFLEKKALSDWSAPYPIPAENKTPKTVGIVMAGNIPLVGFHDFLCTFLSGHRQVIKPSSKDDVLIRHLAGKLIEMDEACSSCISFAEMLKGCDAYIATGSNNSARYFEYYFRNHPHIIRRNRTSVAILNGKENVTDLEKLADDVYLYFGLGCRNVTKLYVPQQYDFVPLLEAFSKYNYLSDHNKYKNNYDYLLAIMILNKQVYMTNGSLLMLEHSSVFSPVGQLNYEFYSDEKELLNFLQSNEDIQCIVGKDHIPFGQAQQPSLHDFADGTDTLQFLLDL